MVPGTVPGTTMANLFDTWVVCEPQLLPICANLLQEFVLPPHYLHKKPDHILKIPYSYLFINRMY